MSVTDSTPRTQSTDHAASTRADTPTAVILAIDTPTLGDRSYLVHDGQVALVIDPQRDIDRVLDLARTEGVRITHIFETHIHNDYVTGGLALARETGAAYHVNAADPVAYERTGVRDGDIIDVSPALRVRVLATPGHTYTHLSYVLEERGTQTAVFSGGSLLFGSTGRPDLLGADPHPRSGASPVRLGAAAGRGTAGPDPGDAHPRVRQLLLGHPVRGHRLDDRGGEGHEPGAHPGRGALRRRASRRPGRLPGLLRADGPGEHRGPGGAGSEPAGDRRRRAVARAGWNRGSGWSIFVPGPPSPPGTRRAP